VSYRFSVVLLSVALISTSALALAPPGKAKSKVDVTGSLVRQDSPIDADARGMIRFRSKTKKGDGVARMDVLVRKVDVSPEHRLFLEDGVGAGTFSDLGAMDVSDGKLRWSVDEGQGDALPLGAESLADLEGRRVEVRRDGDVVLEGVGPALDASKKPVKHKAKLEAPNAEGDPSLKGRLQMRSKADKGQHRLVIKIKKAPFSSSDVHLFVESAEGSGVFMDAGQFDRLGTSANGRFRRDTHKGAPLPLGVSDLDELSGRRLQVRDDFDEVLLEVTLPKVP
jgi:hypothetical protein